MKKSLLTFMSIGCMILSLQAQPKLVRSIGGFVNISQPQGDWTFKLYPGHIINAIFIPKGSIRNDQASDAVVLERLEQKPLCRASQGELTVSWGKSSVVVENEAIRFRLENGQTIRLINSFYNDSERGFRFSLQDNEKIFGTGERSLPLNRRGYKLPLYNNPWYGYSLDADALNYSVPMLVSSNRYALFFDNPSTGSLDVGKTVANELTYQAGSGLLSFYIIPGNDYTDILTRYHRLTGTQPLPPRWAMGNFLSRFGYRSEKQVTDIINRMQQDSIPFDAVIFDLFWFGDSIKNTLGNLDWMNPVAWPAPEKMIRSWKQNNIQTILITEPFVLQTSKHYEEAKPFLAKDSTGRPYSLTDFYFGKGGLIDIFQRPAADWFYSKYKKQIELGVEGWWGDLGEPEKHPADMIHDLSSQGLYSRFRASEVHNIYGHQWSRSLFERFQKDYPGKRLFHLNRSGFAGTPRYSSFPWSGDVSRSWNGMKAQIPLMLGMSLSGVPYIHSDAGGFAGGDMDAELYVRWLQFAAFTPIFRPHGTALGEIEPTVKDIPSEPALWPEPTRTLAKQAVKMRYKWLPYNYTLSYEQTVSGKPLMKPLFFLHSSDTNLYRATDQYLWGDQVMVIPVTEAGQRNKTYYIPEGTWTRQHDGFRLTGPQWFTDNQLTLEHTPLWIREGSFIPTVEGMINTSTYDQQDLIITYYPSQKASRYTLFEDDGKNAFSIKKKQFELTTFTSSGVGKKWKIDIRSNGGSYPGQQQKRKLTLKIPGISQPVAIRINGKDSKAKSHWNEATRLLELSFDYAHQPMQIEIQLR